jgi:DNA helicase-2/ATP-dependent DNA helicase PcrA
VYGLRHFFRDLFDDPEGQIYLEVFTRQLSACAAIGTYGGDLLGSPASDAAVLAAGKELLRLFLAPIASGATGVNEDLIEVFPRGRLAVLSIHQAKGLEFPLTIVDVGSDFRTNHRNHAFKRFPNGGSLPHALEDLMGPYSELGVPSRTARDRAFDDLYRQFFVAFSRPEHVLLLVGLDGTAPGGGIPNVATGSRRDATNSWSNRRPYEEI